MGVSYMVRGSTEAECRRELDWLCAQRGARPTMLPTTGLGGGWVAKAVPMPKAPASGEGLVEQ